MFGVPQGSILGPPLVTLFLLPLAHAFQKHKINYQSYTDNSLLSDRHFSLDDLAPTCSLSQCLDNIVLWMPENVCVSVWPQSVVSVVSTYTLIMPMMLIEFCDFPSGNWLLLRQCLDHLYEACSVCLSMKCATQSRKRKNTKVP